MRSDSLNCFYFMLLYSHKKVKEKMPRIKTKNEDESYERP